jgi:23S rRNA U2552 (ribose-2'-O)-methylase RlmE/FtsJ
MLSSYKLFIKSKNYSIKWQKYFDVYDIIFKKFRKKKITFVEVGVLNGGSLEIWKKYFHPKSRIIGIDLNPKCKKFQKSGIEIIIGDQSDENFWNKFYKKVGKIDILLDDGGHTNKQQIITYFEALAKTVGILRQPVEDSYLQNQIDEIMALIESTLYKLKYLN